MFYNGRIIITFNSFPNECQNSQVFTHSDTKMTFSFAINDNISASTLQFVNTCGTPERWISVFKYKKVTNFVLSLESKPDITVQETRNGLPHFRSILWATVTPTYKLA